MQRPIGLQAAYQDGDQTMFKTDFARAACGVVIALSCGAALAQSEHHHAAMAMPATAAPPPFVASTAKPFSQLMDDAMAVMDYGMRTAPMNGQAEHDFVTMMIPHHQGAIDMAKALLLTTQDPALRNLTQQIIADQQIEIQLMNAWLKEHPDTSAKPTVAP
jgi:uncharacterized protein (DUF305 family)